jgi:hypothetical protein
VKGGIDMHDSKKYEILLNNVNDVRNLVYTATTCRVVGKITGINTEANINSILGLFRLDLTHPHTLEVSSKEPSDIDSFIDTLKSQNIQVEPVAA